jgi:hypothetical protein
MEHWPKISVEQRRKSYADAGIANARAHMKKAWAAHCALRARLPAAARRNLHDLGEEEASRRGRKFRLHACSRCGGCYTFGDAKRLPCPATPAKDKMTCRNFALATRAAGGWTSFRAANVTDEHDPRPSAARRAPKVVLGAGAAKRRLQKRAQPSATRISR